MRGHQYIRRLYGIFETQRVRCQQVLPTRGLEVTGKQKPESIDRDIKYEAEIVFVIERWTGVPERGPGHSWKLRWAEPPHAAHQLYEHADARAVTGLTLEFEQGLRRDRGVP